MVLLSTRTKLAAAGCAWLYSGLCACRPGVEATPPALPSPPAPPIAEPSPSPPAAPGADVSTNQPRSDADDEFLVVTGSGDLVLRTAKAVVRVLARSVSGALYDPKLELVWLEGDSLRVVDLRRPGADPLLIVREWQGTSSADIYWIGAGRKLSPAPPTSSLRRSGRGR